MAKKRPRGPKPHAFRDKLLLNQWLVSLFGIDPLAYDSAHVEKGRPFHALADPIKDPRLEGLDHDNLHHFHHALVNSVMLMNESRALSEERLLQYEENIARCTLAINEKRRRPVVWKYFQWLSLLFVEIYLDRFFSAREEMLAELNAFVKRFNRYWTAYADVPLYEVDDLNKLCLQNATGSGKTLLMHVNLLQFRHYAAKHGKERELSRIILLTPNERLSEQHIAEFRESAIRAEAYLENRGGLFGAAQGLDRVDVLEITKLADKEGPNTVAARSLGGWNLLLVDEGHRGMSGKETGAWFTRRGELCAKGFTFEYSATFEQAVKASGAAGFENSYAKSILFDYSYRWFYEDGFGKDYQILNLPKSFEETQYVYMTACLLKFYQQLRIFEEKTKAFEPFNLEKPLWVFVGGTVSKARGTKYEKAVATDVARIIQFIAEFLGDQRKARRRVNEILTGVGRDTGLLDKDGNDIFSGAFSYLAERMNAGETAEALHRDILGRLFNNSAGGSLVMDRVKGDSGEIALRVGAADAPFGLVNVGDAKGLCDHVVDVAADKGVHLTVEDRDFTEAMFASVKESSSPVNLLIGSKKFVEGWDCWRVGTMGLMHVGRGEGSQIIQLFGRGVRLKGYGWSLKRSGHSHASRRPPFIGELELLNVFGIEADFMEKFRDYLKAEGLPGNERRKMITIPLNVTYDFGKKLKILRPRRKSSDGGEYDFKKDAPVPTVGAVPDYLIRNPVIADWYPRIQAMGSKESGRAARKDKVSLREPHLSLLDYDALFLELERFKRERGWRNFNIAKEGVLRLLEDSRWYTLYLPEARLNPTGFDGVMLLQRVAMELLKRYCAHYYNYCKREFIEPRLELRELTPDDDNLPGDEFYQLIVNGDEEQVVLGIRRLKKELETRKDELLRVGDLSACKFGGHLFQPLFHVRRGGKITILPVALNESEYQFVVDLKHWCEANKTTLAGDGAELFLLRNMSRGKGVGFFEAGAFHPDFIVWMLVNGKQYVTFIEPHGLLHESPASEKVLFHERIKDIEKRLNDPGVILNSFILSWTRYHQLKWGDAREELENRHILFMTDDRDHYIEKLFTRLRAMEKCK